MSYRQDIRDAVTGGRFDELEALVRDDKRAIRHLVGLSYSADPEVGRNAAQGIAIACRYHPDQVTAAVRRLVWAMNEESGANALTAPLVIEAVASEQPELLLPMLPDLLRLSRDPSLRAGLRRALRTVVEACPGKVGSALEKDLNQPEVMLQEELDRKARKKR